MAEFSIVPIGTGETSVSSYVAAAVDALSGVRGLELQVTPMGTVLAAKDLKTILDAVRVAHEVLFSLGIKRVSSTLKLDDRRDKSRTMNDKVKAVNEKLKRRT